MSQRFPVYIFRDSHFASAGDTVVTLAPIDLVVSVFGGGGLKGEGGLEHRTIKRTHSRQL
jgi:hypothetical protein